MNFRIKGVKIATVLAVTLTVAVLLSGILVSFWNLQNPDILEVKTYKLPDGGMSYPFPVRPDNNTPGQVEFMAVDYCKTYAARGRVEARMVGKKSIIRIPWPMETQPSQCLKTEALIVIPTYAVDDIYYFDFTITYKVNPLKKKVVYLRSQSFTIAKRE